MPAPDPSAWVVHKFGGSSVADAECFHRVANILETLPPGRLGVVLSACRGVTDALLGLVARAEAQDDSYRGELDALRHGWSQQGRDGHGRVQGRRRQHGDPLQISAAADAPDRAVARLRPASTLVVRGSRRP